MLFQSDFKQKQVNQERHTAMTATLNSQNQPNHKLPVLKWHKTPEGYKERLERWLLSWNLEQDLRKQSPEYAQPLPFAPRGVQVTDPLWKRLAEPDQPDVAPEVGQIRLLAGWAVPQARRPVYVAVLYRWEGDVFVVVPFGGFPEPSTHTELLTGRDHQAFKVLCLWNTRTLSPHALAEASRYVDKMNEEELKDSRTVFRHALAGEDMPDELWDRVGCPIVHPRDPRIAYQDEETLLLKFLRSSSEA